MEQSNKTATNWSSYSVYECDHVHTNKAKYPPYPTTSIIPKTIEVNGEEVNWNFGTLPEFPEVLGR